MFTFRAPTNPYNYSLRSATAQPLESLADSSRLGSTFCFPSASAQPFSAPIVADSSPIAHRLRSASRSPSLNDVDVSARSDDSIANIDDPPPHPARNRAPRTATFGLLYPTYGFDPVNKVYPSDFAQRAAAGRLPDVSLHELFQAPNNVLGPLDIHRALVIVGNRRFMVYGYVHPDAEINETISQIKPSSIWRGEIVLFSLGRHVPFLSRPSARRTVLNKVVARFVSRMTEAYDEGTAPPTQISMTR